MDFWTGTQATSKSEDWATPLEFFNLLHAEFDFTLDVCASEWNAKCPKFFTKQQDGLDRPWAPERCWMNPPYGRDIGRWMAKARDEARSGALVVCLVPARTDTTWWHEFIGQRAEVRFVKGRLKFVHQDGRGDPAPFPSAVVIYRPRVA